MGKLDKVFQTLQDLEKHKSYRAFPDPLVGLPITILYLCLLLSIPLHRVTMLIWMGLYPIIACACAGQTYGKVFLKSLIILPLCIFIGIFNPLYQHSVVATIGSFNITQGWISLISICIRGVFALQSVIILIESNGFISICRTMRRFGIPSFITDQLQFVYRYIMVILKETITMRNARMARGYGRKKYPLKMWSAFVGQLFLRSIDRSERISKAMSARGFKGEMIDYHTYISNMQHKLSFSNILYLLTWGTVLPLLRFTDLSSIFFR
ncbi:MAG: energy-coupling factor transporter transmembrane protein EcfT [Muribaculaceae bacterium]|nr:energy-coupling factor transporter transmembrane protein EcfT [Muribaculaceae bacterium]